MDSRAGRVGIVLNDIGLDCLVPRMAADLGLGALGELLGEGVGPGEPDAVILPSIEDELQFISGGLIETIFELMKVIQWASACISGNRYYDGPFP